MVYLSNFQNFKCDVATSFGFEEEKKAGFFKKTMEALASTSICNEHTTCKFIGLKRSRF